MSRIPLFLLAALALPCPALAAGGTCPLDRMIYEEPFTGTLYVVEEVRSQPGGPDAILVGRMTAPDAGRSSSLIALEIALADGLVKSGWKEGDAEMTALLDLHPLAPQAGLPAAPSRLHFEESTVFSPKLEDNFGELKASGCRTE